MRLVRPTARVPLCQRTSCLQRCFRLFLAGPPRPLKAVLFSAMPFTPPTWCRLMLLLLLLSLVFWFSSINACRRLPSLFFGRLLNKLDAAISTSPFLENITLVDTPGVLSGEMQMHQRAYSFADVSLDCPKLVGCGEPLPLLAVLAAYPLLCTFLFA